MKNVTSCGILDTSNLTIHSEIKTKLVLEDIKMFEKRKLFKLNTFQIIVLGFFLVILVGALLLMLPFASKEGKVTPFVDALFTSTSCVCVTGLVVRDTGSYWSIFGHIVIIMLIQIGGLGVITLTMLFFIVFGKKISLSNRTTIQETLSSPSLSGVIRMIKFIVFGTFFIEFIGAICLLFPFCQEYGIKGIGFAIFHSISAFCNAGFDLLGDTSNLYPSLTNVSDNIIINVIIMLLIIIGGLGFFTWHDIKQKKFNFRKYSMQSKVIIITSICLIIFPAIYYFFFEYADCKIKERILASLFQSVTARTAGFNTKDLAEMSDGGRAIMIGLMLIGGAPGSTAGGMKVTTFVVVFANAFSVFNQNNDVTFFRRRIDNQTIRNACTILVIYLVLFLGCGIVIHMLDGIPLSYALFETASAIGTVGLSLGVTPNLCIVSHIILLVLMFFGRVGALTFIFASTYISNTGHNLYRLSHVNIAIG